MGTLRFSEWKGKTGKNKTANRSKSVVLISMFNIFSKP